MEVLALEGVRRGRPASTSSLARHPARSAAEGKVAFRSPIAFGASRGTRLEPVATSLCRRKRRGSGSGQSARADWIASAGE